MKVIKEHDCPFKHHGEQALIVMIWGNNEGEAVSFVITFFINYEKEHT